MNCAECGSANREGRRFCGGCGAALAAACEACGFVNEAAEKFCGGCGTALAPGPAAALPATIARTRGREPAAQGEAERRQLTVMFCDLVGSTALSARFDPEDLRELIGAFQQASVGVIERMGGIVARYMGDGLLVYFGYPQAGEDDAERAVSAGLGVVEAVAALAVPDDVRLRVRVGIATGLVVAGDIVGEGAAEEHAVLGETPNLAARLQGLAEPDTVVIGPVTHRLVGGLFECAELGQHTLKGFPEPVSAWRVMGASEAETRFDALRIGTLTPLVGREKELALLADAWRSACRGNGGVAVLTGEAGIGKSRIVQALAETAAGEAGHTRLNFQCSSHHTDSALHPVIAQLERWAGFAPGDENEAKLDKLEEQARIAALPVAETAPLLAALVSVPVDGRYPPLALSPGLRKSRTLDALVARVLAFADGRPLLLVLEDAQSVDPTSAELFERIVNRAPEAPCLVIVTARPGYSPPWEGLAHVLTIRLDRLGPRQCRALAEGLATTAGLGDDVLAAIVARADGVPLFVEELTRAVLEAGVGGIEDAGGPEIPATLKDALMARLDRLGPAKRVAQTGAVIGREFDIELIAEVMTLDDDALGRALERLRRADLVFQPGMPFIATYVFKHGLVHETAYGSVLKRSRQDLHGRIAEIIESGFHDIAKSRPEVIARHYTDAGRFSESVAHWVRAVEASVRRSAMPEAVALSRRGLAAIENLAPGPEQARAELALRTVMQLPLRATRGLADAEVETNCARGYALCGETDDNAPLLPLLYGLFAVPWARGDIAEGRARARRLDERAVETGEETARLVAAYAGGMISLFAAENEDALARLKTVLAGYDPERHAALALAYAQEFGVGAHNYLGLAYAFCGRFPDCRREVHEAVALARALAQPFPLAHALAVGAAAIAFLGDSQATSALADEATAVSREQGFAPYVALGRICGGWARAREGQARDGIAEMEQGIEDWKRVGYGLAVPLFGSLLCEAYVADGRADAALSLGTELLSHVERSGQAQFESPVRAALGDAWNALDGSSDKAMDAYVSALEAARRQRAPGHELRVALRLARVWRESGRDREARDLLADALASTDGGDDVPVVAEGRKLAEEAGARPVTDGLD